MKQITIKVPIKTNDLVTEITHSYEEVETLADLSSFNSERVVKIFNTGLRMMERNRVRANNNFSSLAQKLVAANCFSDEKSAIAFIIEQKKARGQV